MVNAVEISCSRAFSAFILASSLVSSVSSAGDLQVGSMGVSASSVETVTSSLVTATSSVVSSVVIGSGAAESSAPGCWDPWSL